MAFTPDGSAFALTTGLGDTTVWRLEDGQEIARLSTPDLGGRARLGAQGQRIAGLSDLHATEVWDVRSGERIVRIRHGGSSWRPLLSPDSSLVAVKRKSELSVYALPSGERVSHVEIDPELEIRDVAFSPGSGQVAIGGEDERVTLWDVKRDSLIARLRHSGEISDVVFAADARYLVTNQVDGTVRVFATDGWKEVARLAHDAPVVDIAVGTRRVATADQLRGVRVWDIPSGRQLMEIEHGEEVQLVSVTPGSEVVGVAGRHTLAAVAIDSGVAVLERRFLSVVTAFQHSKDGRYLAVGLSDGDAAAWDVIARTQVLDVRGTGTPGDVRRVAYSSDGDHLVTVAEEAHVWDLRDGRELARIQTGSVGGAGALSPDGALFAVGGSSRLTVFDVTTAQPVLKGNLDPGITSVAFSPDGALVAAAGPMGPLARVWRVATGEVARTITVDAANGLFGVAFHPDGQRIITAGRDGSVRFWSLSDGAEVGRVLQGTAVLGLDISADGRLMATTSRDYVVRVWSLDDNRLVGLIPHGMPTRSVALSGEGKQLATVNADQELSVWHLDSERLLADACDRLSRNLSWAEWQQYFGDAPYRKTCGHLPLHPSFVRAAFEIAQSGDPERARSQLLHAQELDPALDLGVDEAMLDIARSLDREGVELAEREEIGRAAQRFEAAVLAANEEPYDYRGRARSIAIAETIEVGIDQALDGKAADALAAFAHAAEIDPTVEFTARVWNDLCWFGAVHGHAAKVLGACDKTVELADEDLAGFSADSRGVARLAAGDPEGAISDFESFLRWAEDMDSMADLVTTRTEWITALKQGTDPLEGMDLRTHSNYMASYREKLGLRWQRISIDPGG
jgi:WD40 repeat protein